MDAQKAQMFLLSNKDNFPADKLPYIKDKLMSLDDSKAEALMYNINVKSPVVALILSLLVGCFGVDRFYLGSGRHRNR